MFEFSLLSLEAMGPVTFEMLVMYEGEILDTMDITEDVFIGWDRNAVHAQLAATEDYDGEAGFASSSSSSGSGFSSSSASAMPARIGELKTNSYYAAHGSAINSF